MALGGQEGLLPFLLPFGTAHVLPLTQASLNRTWSHCERDSLMLPATSGQSLSFWAQHSRPLTVPEPRAPVPSTRQALPPYALHHASSCNTHVPSLGGLPGHTWPSPRAPHGLSVPHHCSRWCPRSHWVGSLVGAGRRAQHLLRSDVVQRPPPQLWGHGDRPLPQRSSGKAGRPRPSSAY